MLRITSSPSGNAVFGVFRLYLDRHACDSASPPIKLTISPDFSDRDRRDLYIRGRAGRSAADRAVQPSSKAQTQ
jgi:hypothetical protein